MIRHIWDDQFVDRVELGARETDALLWVFFYSKGLEWALSGGYGQTIDRDGISPWRSWRQLNWDVNFNVITFPSEKLACVSSNFDIVTFPSVKLECVSSSLVMMYFYDFINSNKLITLCWSGSLTWTNNQEV